MPDKRTPRRVYALLGFMVFVWSINFIVAKTALKEFPPLLLGALRFSLAGVIITPVYLMRPRKPIARGELWKLLGIGIVGVGINQLAFLLGLIRTSVGHAAILICLTPVFTLLLSSYAGHEKITRYKLAGLILAISGVGVLQGGNIFTGHGNPLGDLFIVVSSFTFAFFAVSGKTIREHTSGLTINTVAYLGSTVILSPVTFFLAKDFNFAGVSATGWICVLFIAVFPSLIAYLIYYHALHYMPATRISMLAYLQPVIATSFAIPILGEKVTSSLLIGGALVLAGVAAANAGAKKDGHPEASVADPEGQEALTQ